MTDLEKELREFLADEIVCQPFHAESEWDSGFISGEISAFERVLKFLDGER